MAGRTDDVANHYIVLGTVSPSAGSTNVAVEGHIASFNEVNWFYSSNMCDIIQCTRSYPSYALNYRSLETSDSWRTERSAF